MNLDSMVRDTLRARAHDAPANVGLLDAARDRSHRRRRRRSAVLAGVAAVAVAAAGLAGVTAVRGPDGPVPPAGPVTLVPPSYQLPAFPFTPGDPPAGSGEPYAGFSEQSAWLVHPGADGGTRYRVEVRAGHLTLAEVTGDSTGGAPAGLPVRGTDASVTFANPFLALTWRHTTGQWVTVSSHEGRFDSVRTYAEALVETPLPVREPFTFDLVPAGTAPVLVQRDAVILAPAGAGATAGLHGAVLVELSAPDAAVPTRLGIPLGMPWAGDGERLRAGGHDAELVHGVRATTLRVFLDDGSVLHVTASGELRLSRDDLIRFAAGVRLTPHARPHG